MSSVRNVLFLYNFHDFCNKSLLKHCMKVWIDQGARSLIKWLIVAEINVQERLSPTKNY